MATRYSIFPSIDSGSGDDRVYNAVDFLARPSQDFLAGEGDGVSREVGNAMAVTETSPASLAVDVSTGVARANGYRFEVFTASEEVALSAADPTDPRIDRIVVQARTDAANRDMRLTVIEGTPATSPSAPALTRTSDTYEISLAQVLVGAGVTSVSNTEITDERGDNSVCGWLQPQLMGRIGIPMAATDEGTDAYEFDVGGDLNIGDTFVLDIDSANTTATPTLENTGGAPAGAQSIVTTEGAAFVDMLEARPHRFQWDGTNFVVLDPAGGAVQVDTTTGRTVRYADGTQIAETSIQLTQLTTATMQAIWTFDLAFNAEPRVSFSLDLDSNNLTPSIQSMSVQGLSSLSTTSTRLRLLKQADAPNFGASDTINAKATAVGRWK